MADPEPPLPPSAPTAPQPTGPNDLCAKCAFRLKPGDAACPECGHVRGEAPRGVGPWGAAGLVLWPLLLYFFVFSGRNTPALLLMAGFLHLINGPVAITIISRSYVPERLAKRSVFAELRHASPHVYALTLALLTLTWLLPLLVLGACLMLVLSH